MRTAISNGTHRSWWIYSLLAGFALAGMAQNPAPEPQLEPAENAANPGTQTVAAKSKTASVTEIDFDGKVVVIRVTLDDLADGRRFKTLRELLDKSRDAEAIVFDLNVYGSSPWETDQRLLEELPKVKTRTIAFVNPSALVTGAFLAAGSDTIYMTPGSVVGGAGLRAYAEDTEATEEAFKRNYAQSLSIIKARARSLAVLKGHDPEIVEAMVDSEIAVTRGGEEISPKGEILTLTAEEAVRQFDGKPLFADGIAESVDEIKKLEKLKGEIVETDPKSYRDEQARAGRKPPSITGSDTGPRDGDAEQPEAVGDGLFTRKMDESYAGKILVLPIREEDLIIQARFDFMERAVKKAKLDGASAIIIDMNTPGGAAWQTAELMMKTMQETPFPTYTFVNPNAVSAGSLIAVSTDTIYMYPASNIGSALVVSGSGMELGENMQQKVDQMMISTVRNVAELKGHNPDVAEAFVNKEKEVIIEGVTVSEAGTVLNLNANEATEVLDGKPVLAKGIARTVEEIIELEGLEGEVHEVQPLGLESFAHWVQSFSALLIVLGLAGAYMELQAPGFGVPGVVSLLAFGLFFFGNYLAGNLAGYELAVVLVLGLVLIIVEIFILPGTLIPGMIGAVMVVTALGLAMIDRIDFEYKWEGLPNAGSWTDVFSSAAFTLAIGILASIALILAAMRWLPESRMGSWMVLKKAVAGGASLESASFGGDGGETEPESLIGQTGETSTDLYPAGKGRFGDRLLDIISDGEYIDKGSPVRVVKHEGSRIVVRRI